MYVHGFCVNNPVSLYRTSGLNVVVVVHRRGNKISLGLWLLKFQRFQCIHKKGGWFTDARPLELRLPFRGCSQLTKPMLLCLKNRQMRRKEMKKETCHCK